MHTPGQYTLAYVQSFLEARADENDLPHMERLLAEARQLIQPR